MDCGGTEVVELVEAMVKLLGELGVSGIIGEEDVVVFWRPLIVIEDVSDIRCWVPKVN